jgi:hypothetical protein
MKQLLQRRESPVLLGLALDGSRLEAVLVRRSNGSAELVKSLSVTLALDPLTNEPELVGQEIRNHLETAGIRERRCVVGIPLKWALTLSLALPEIPDEDVSEFLQIEAERSFSIDPESLLIGRSMARIGATGWATQVAVPLNHLSRLEEVLAAAHLKPVNFAPGVLALQPVGAPKAPGVLALSVGEDGVDLLVTAGGGIIALRSLAGALEGEGAQREVDSDFVARELRITLGQLPAEIQACVRQVKVFGQGEPARHLADEIRPAATALGLTVERVTAYGVGELGVQLPAGVPVSAVVSQAVRRLAGQAPELDFIPPKVSAWQAFAARYSSAKLVWTGASAGAVAAIVLIAFLVQQWQISSLQSEWDSRRVAYEELSDLQTQIRKYRPWFDTSYTSLTILRNLTQSFPETGSVTAKTVEIRNLTSVACTGTTTDNQALVRTLEQLRAVRQVHDVKLDTLRGERPKQFTFNFQWGEGGSSEN